jgi:hypothetical protein
MTENNQEDIAPEDGGEGATLSHSKGRRAFSRLRRELTDEELSSPAVQRLLIDDIERLEKENGRLIEYQDSFYSADKLVATLSEKLKTNTAQEIVFGVCLTVGAALIGVAPSLWNSTNLHGQISIALGAILIVGGIASKVVSKR